MSGYNPFRRNLNGGSVTAIAPPPAMSNVASVPSKPSVPMVPNGYPGKSSLSLEIEAEDSTSSDEQAANPFNPDSAVSDNDGDDEDDAESSKGFPNRPRASLGSAPHPAPSDGSSTIAPSEPPFTLSEHNMRSAADIEAYKSTQGIHSTMRRPPEQDEVTGRPKDKKPPPPPRSHHGKRISTASNTPSPSHATSRPNHRHSYHASSRESSTSAQASGTPNVSSVSNPPLMDYFSIHSKNPRVTESTDSLRRSNSQPKRPPTPPLSRRHSQMRRSKSTQSKSSGSRLTMSSLDSESNDSYQPPSPGPSTHSVASSVSRDRKRISMPPSSRELRSGMADSLYSPPNSRSNQAGRRASSYGSLGTGSSSTAPPPPPPRRGRDSNIRGSDGSSSQATKEDLLPQPSNAHDILADLSRLQKEVDDLRGHYESRKASD
ncbi:hypothetical protein PENDEC_c003G02713 [Penicillium decumbens]|uniref:Uncharacterized protein n=1 Tax=Penicillium decumbens TaxID=69771 RepID=A0A1V6PJR1_PENDC|nr:hypothetical protein PENDEC_c003G02713 [Penicillium decumbens]